MNSYKKSTSLYSYIKNTRRQCIKCNEMKMNITCKFVIRIKIINEKSKNQY